MKWRTVSGFLGAAWVTSIGDRVLLH